MDYHVCKGGAKRVTSMRICSPARTAQASRVRRGCVGAVAGCRARPRTPGAAAVPDAVLPRPPFQWPRAHSRRPGVCYSVVRLACEG